MRGIDLHDFFGPTANINSLVTYECSATYEDGVYKVHAKDFEGYEGESEDLTEATDDLLAQIQEVVVAAIEVGDATLELMPKPKHGRLCEAKEKGLGLSLNVDIAASIQLASQHLERAKAARDAGDKRVCIDFLIMAHDLIGGVLSMAISNNMPPDFLRFLSNLFEEVRRDGKEEDGEE